jgi:hypothetical protein
MAVPYCLCEDPDNAFVESPMTCTLTGASRVDEFGHRVYPNVDIYTCNKCGAKIALEVK